MAYYYNEYVEAVKRKLHSPLNVSEEEYEAVVDEAIESYSLYYPDTGVHDATGTITNYLISLPTDYADGFSNIISIEYPYDATDQSPAILDDTDYLIYVDSGGTKKIKCLTFSPDSTETTRITYTKMHVVTTTSSTIPVIHEKAVANLGAAILAEMLAAEYAQETRSALPDIAFDLRTKADEYHRLADRYYTLWRRGSGVSEDDRPPAACTWTNTNMKYSWGKKWLVRTGR